MGCINHPFYSLQMIRYKTNGISTDIDKVDIVRESTTHIFIRSKKGSNMLDRHKKGPGDKHFSTYDQANSHLINVITNKVKSIRKMLTESQKDLKLLKERALPEVLSTKKDDGKQD